MIFEPAPVAGAVVISPLRFEDERGFFMRTYCEREFADNALNVHWVQTNASFNRSKFTMRGMHWQEAPHGEIKLVRCAAGAIYDVIIDLRPNSATYRQHFGIHLTEENGKQLYIPEGFAHGFLTLAENTRVDYHMSAFFEPGAGRGLRYNDPTFGIEWPGPVHVIAERDRTYPDFEG